MFYETETNDHGMRHDPFKAIVAPRPIGWIGTKGRDGSINLSPYSFFNIVSDNPKIVMFSSSGRKDSLRNAEETGVFTASLASRDLADQVNASSA
ncbi:MAG TPA: flavin reductase family protein, partial [Pseudorhizobium sp.]|nr:flavin reductase family protein [Pseudorhizobium sp.]